MADDFREKCDGAIVVEAIFDKGVSRVLAAGIALIFGSNHVNKDIVGDIPDGRFKAFGNLLGEGLVTPLKLVRGINVTRLDIDPYVHLGRQNRTGQFIDATIGLGFIERLF